jgi:Nickel responsive protein SCO4226-like
LARLRLVASCLAVERANPPVVGGRKEKWHDALYMDRPKNLEGLTAQAVAEDHKKDLEVQDQHGAKALKYWFNEEKGEVYCLFEAPNAEAAEAVHREAHGNVADEIIEVKEGS